LQRGFDRIRLEHENYWPGFVLLFISHLICALALSCRLTNLPFALRLVSGKVPNLLRKHVQLASLRRTEPWGIYGRRFQAVILCCCSYLILHRCALCLARFCTVSGWRCFATCWFN
jgi:hypothetical protein